MKFVTAACCALLLAGPISIGGQTPAPSPSTPSFAGRWIFERPPVIGVAPSSAQASVTIEPTDELLVSQNQAALTVGHPSRRGAHPREAVHFFGARGNVNSGGMSYRSSVSWLGRELIISSTIETKGSNGEVTTASSSEKWTLESDERLVIEVVEERNGTNAAKDTLVYRKR